MASPEEEARSYLAAELREKGIQMSDASKAIGRNHAYLQQYLKDGKPRWLMESDREALAAAYQLDGVKLKPPPKPLSPASGSRKKATTKRHDEPEINAPRYGQIVDDPGTLELLRVWDRIKSPADREIAMRILRMMASQNSAAVA